MTKNTRLLSASAVTLVLGCPGVGASSSRLESSNAARSLVDLLEAKHLSAIAAPDPADTGTFVAALYVPGSQLLVVSTRHPSADAVLYRIAARQYREVYLDLQGSPVREGKFFIQDSGADGIVAGGRGSGDVDILYEDGVRQTIFNGDTRAQHLSKADYESRLARADSSYARLLMLLVSQIKAQDDAGEASRGQLSDP